MEHEAVRQLTAAYALDALDAEDERLVEGHLRVCDACRAELAELREAAAALPFALEAPAPPPALRDRLLESARAERTNVVPLRGRRWPLPVTAAAAAAAAVAAVALGVRAGDLAGDLERERAAARVLADPAAERIPMGGRAGRLVVAPSGEAVLVVSGVERAPEGKTYQLWVIDGGSPRPAGLFGGGGEREIVPLDRAVREGDTVAVTLERSGGADAPTGEPLMSARA